MRAEHLDVRASDSLLSHARVAVVVGKQGHTIVERNRLRRRLRELSRTHLIPGLKEVDLVIRALGSAYHATFEELATDIARITRQLSRYQMQ